MSLAEKIRHLKVAPGELAICWLGQAGFLLKDSQGTELVIDPYLTNCGERLRGFKRLSPILLRPEELAPDYYIITHLHFDHFDYDAVPEVIRRTKKTLFLGPSSCQEKLRELKAPPEQRYRLDRGDIFEDEKVKIYGTLADHGTMAPDAIGAVVEMSGHRLYFSGDTAFHEKLFRQVAALKLDVAMLSVNGRFGNMNAEEGARAAILSGVKYAIPCHCWTFAEHGGDPGRFCELLGESRACIPLCFYQGEIQILKSNNDLQYRKEPA